MKRRPLKPRLPILLAALFLLNTLTVLAAEPDAAAQAEPPAVTESGPPAPPQEPTPEPTPSQEPDPTPGPTPAPEPTPDQEETPPAVDSPEAGEEWREAGSFEAFCEVLDELGQTGGKLRLTAPITVPAGETYYYVPSRQRPYVELDVGGHTITVEGELNFCFFQRIFGVGGESGLFSVRTGGRLTFASCALEARSGFAIRQEPGAALIYGAYMTGEPEFTCKGEIEATVPVAVESYWAYTKAVLVPAGGEAADYLPAECNGTIIENGEESRETAMGVQWDTDECSEAFARRERFTITGSFTDYATFQPIQCVVAFEADRPATLLSCGSKNNANKNTIVYADYALSSTDTVERVALEWSPDGEQWEAVDELSAMDDWILGDIPTVQYPLYLSLVVTDEDGSVGYSDVVVLTSEDSNGDMGGNRRGGTGVTPPELPPANGEDTEDGDNGDGDTGDGGMDGVAPGQPDDSGRSDGTQPPGGGVAGAPEGSELPIIPPDDDEEPEQSIPPAVMPEETVPPAGIPPAAEPPAQSTLPVGTQPPMAKTPEQDAASTSSPQPTADALEAMAQMPTDAELDLSGKPGSPSARAVAQVAVGVTATGGIVILTMTSASWSKRLLSLLRKLLKR